MRFHYEKLLFHVTTSSGSTVTRSPPRLLTANATASDPLHVCARAWPRERTHVRSRRARRAPMLVAPPAVRGAVFNGTKTTAKEAPSSVDRARGSCAAKDLFLPTRSQATGHARGWTTACAKATAKEACVEST
jgi:hypothetical protein